VGALGVLGGGMVRKVFDVKWGDLPGGEIQAGVRAQ